MKSIFTFLAIVFICSKLACQDLIFQENFDGPVMPLLPGGWITTTNYGIGFRSDSTNSSNYNDTASGVNNIVIRNSDSTGTYNLYCPVFSTSGFSQIKLSFASRVSNNYLTSGSSLPLLEISSNGGISWNALPYAENEANSSWSLVNDSIPIELPIEAADNPSVQLRWTVNIQTDPSGTYRLDDLKVEGVANTLVNLNIRVNMANESVSGDGVFIAGDFNGWESGAALMTNIGGSIYQYSLQIEPNSTMNFRFYNGADASGSELVPDICGVDDGNGGGMLGRSFTIGDSDATYGPICFGTCEDCIIAEPNIVNITFRVNMAQQMVSANGVHVMGNFQGWNATSALMTETQPGYFEYVAQIQEGTEVIYRFVNGDQFTNSEIVPGLCANPDGLNVNSRLIYAGAEDQILPLVCYSECAECIMPHVEDEVVSLFGIFPNPVTNNLFVRNMGGLEVKMIKIISSSGELVYAENPLSDVSVINLSFLSGGIYTVLIETHNHYFTERIIKLN
jgi:hypothetical protein